MECLCFEEYEVVVLFVLTCRHGDMPDKNCKLSSMIKYLYDFKQNVKA